MDTVYRVASAAARIVRSRLFAATALAVASAVMVAAVSLNMNAVTVVAGDTSKVVLTLEDNPHRALSGAGIALQEGDEVLTAANNQLVEVNRAFDVQVTADGITTLLRMTDGTVADALAKAGVEAGEQDRLSVAADTPVDADMEIVLDRIAYEEYTETQTVAYTSETRYSGALAKGQTVVRQAGRNGVKTLTYRRCYENGEVVSTDLVSEEITTAPVNEIILKGTEVGTPVSPAPYEIELDEAGQPIGYKKVLNGRVSAYTNDRGLAGNWTASGRRAQVGVVGVDPRIIPYGTELYIVSPDGATVYGYAVAGDTGGGCLNGTVLSDVFMNTYEECRQFGSRNMNVYILN